MAANQSGRPAPVRRQLYTAPSSIQGPQPRLQLNRRHQWALAVATSVVLGWHLSWAALAVDPLGTIKSLTFKDADGLEHEELAFRAPMEGYPEHVLKIYCAHVKLRVYWDVYREHFKDVLRKGLNLRRMARMARHLYEDIRTVDQPFNATMLSVFDEWFPHDSDEEDVYAEESERVCRATPDTTINVRPEVRCEASQQTKASVSKQTFLQLVEKGPPPLSPHENSHSTMTMSDKANPPRPETTGAEGQSSKKGATVSSGAEFPEAQEEAIESKQVIKQLVDDSATGSSNQSLVKKVKSFIVKWTPKVALGIYTRWRTMWWLMMTCLFTKYYLWDPALDEFIKLKRTLVMWPEFQLLRLQDIGCQPVRFFQRILDVCKILNPLMKFSLGTMSLDRLTRFKKDGP